MISFKGAHFPKPVITFAVYFYLRYGVSYQVLSQKSISAGRGPFGAQLSGEFGKLAETARPEAQLAFADHVSHFDPGQRRGC